MRTIILLLTFLIFSLSYGVEIRSDIRLEIISQIKLLQEEKEKLKKDILNADSDEKVYIRKKIKKIDKKIEKLNDLLEHYEKNISNAG
ncbi:MAG TPA: hypothetical protein DEP48_01975 [Persephonella sp.]|uniref:Uncharacterized protein n=1 Tax=Persephonella marina (strain DSM 14350 / EX-H1) TaxID=123214 RepID=C0QRR4_PERMH|nr:MULTISPECIES: hypothetical protein [Persephonella]ACO04332.1 hypothetical protein PERMA_1593 [Persephonella marina EX-H1]HCB69105.1 hypothetical protein [Persephonella sp.]